MTAKQGARRGQSEACPPLLPRNCRSSPTSAATTSRPTAWRDALVARRRCATSRRPTLSFTSARVSRVWCRGWLCPGGVVSRLARLWLLWWPSRTAPTTAARFCDSSNAGVRVSSNRVSTGSSFGDNAEAAAPRHALGIVARRHSSVSCKHQRSRWPVRLPQPLRERRLSDRPPDCLFVTSVQARADSGAPGAAHDPPLRVRAAARR